ncbi:MAG: glycosyltransferase [Acidobacteria bacterium]|nr:glycosyltransferase [Acidobacteriota bacterium]
MGRTLHILKQIAKLLFLCAAPLLLLGMFVGFLATDLLCRLTRLFSVHRPAELDSDGTLDSPPRSASIVIPNWNGKELLAKFLPSIVEATSEQDEIIVVDNASTDGSAEFLRQRFPRVRVIQTERNLGFGGGSNLGIQAARNRIAVLLNNDMRVTPDFLRPLLDGFTDPAVFAVSSQIFFSDPSRRREETGLISGRFEKGFVRVRHEVDPDIPTLYPTFYAGGGSTAYDREKFLELGGFDSLFEPFYLEDTDLSYGAWRRGWKVFYQPASHVFHEHRATIGKHYSRAAILAYLQKNYALMVWKNIHRWRWLASHLVYLYGHMALCWAGKETDTRTTIGSFILALKHFPRALRQRFHALERATINDPAVFARTRPSIFRDVFQSREGARAGTNGKTEIRAPLTPLASNGPTNRPLNILFVSPYSMYPPIHGGAVFMLEAIRELAKRHNIFVLMFVDRAEEVEPNRSLESFVRKVDVHVRRWKQRRNFGLRSNAEETFRDPQFAALLDKAVYLYDIDVIQFEYAQLAQYHLPLEHTPQCLFEHDVYFHSVSRQLASGPGGVFVKAREFVEWLRALRFEVSAAEKFDALFTCNEHEKRLLESFLNGRQPPVYSGVHVAIDVHSYSYHGGPRRPDSLLFVGNFQHQPNVDGLLYFCREVLPLIRAARPTVTFSVAGAHPRAEIQRLLPTVGVEFLGQVPDIRDPLSEYAVFVCPILTGAGVRVKILEAFAAGIPVVSTPLGAEGIAGEDGTHFLLANSPRQFADQTLRLLQHPETAAAMAAQSRELVEELYDWPAAAMRLEGIYRELVATRNG